MTRYTEQKEAEAQRVLMESKAMRERVNHLQMQITHAIRAGKDGFDAENSCKNAKWPPLTTGAETPRN